MEVERTIEGYRSWRSGVGASLGFVPTMGAIHAGHESLIERSVRDCEVTVVSVFVNPTQFDNADDLSGYPTMLEADVEKARQRGADIVFAPDYEAIYPDGYRYLVDETDFSRQLCGAHRTGHFTGVLTVVMKLFNIVRPNRAYFGEKDYQQYMLIRDMAEAFFLDVEVIGCPTVREADGLALSSRNLRLSTSARERAPLIHELIQSSEDDTWVSEQLTQAGFSVDYVETHFGRRFVAARTGSGPDEVRLIDNVRLPGVEI